MWTRSELDQMTITDLKEIAEGQGVQAVDARSKDSWINAILGDAQPRKKDDGSQKEPPLGRLTDLSGKPIVAPWYNLTIYESETDKSDVDLIVNGHNIRVKRNVPVRVMEPYIEVLRNSTIDTIVKDPETGIERPVKRPTYAYVAEKVA